MKHIAIGILFCLSVLITIPAAAQEPPAPVQKMPVVDKIQGDCEYRASEDSDWVAAKVGQAVATGSALCTGFDSSVTVRFPGDSTLEAASLTEVEINTFMDAEKQLEARLKVTVGSVKVRVARGEIQSDFKVSTPHTTTSVKGTFWEVITSFYGDKIIVYENKIKASNNYDRTSEVEEDTKTDDTLRTAAQSERSDRIEPAVPLGNTEDEVEQSTETPANMDQTPTEQSSPANPEQERQTVYGHSG